MNIHMFLMGKNKCQTFFPKLTAKEIIRGSSNKCTKKSSTHKLRNASIDNQQPGRFRLTYHDVLHVPVSASLANSEHKEEEETGIRKLAAVKKVSDSVTKIGVYQICKEIGKGGFAQVFEGQDPNGNKVAIKQYILQNSFECFKNEYTVGDHFFEKGRLRNKFAQRRGGSNLIAFVEKIKYGKKGYIVQELGGKSLSKMISDIQGVFHKGQRVYEVKFSQFYDQLVVVNNMKTLLLQIASGVKLLNQQGFIHCDLKPQNVLVWQINGEISSKIIDFGSAFIYQDGLPKITITPQYMPPQLLMALENDNNSSKLNKIDVWSLGCIMLEIMTGVPLWFRYKCKINIKGRQFLQLGPFALTNRQYHKIVKKQKEICQSIKKMSFIHAEFEAFRKILTRILVFDENQRADINEVIMMLDKLH